MRGVQDMMDPFEIVKTMGGGNPGAITVLSKVAGELGVVPLALTACHLDSAGIYEDDIWVGYKDHCKCDLIKFVTSVADADAGMIKTINEYHEQLGKPLLKWSHQ